MFKKVRIGGFLIPMLSVLLKNQVVPVVSRADHHQLNNWRKTALLVIDIQNDYFPGGKYELYESEKAGLNAQDLLESFRNNQLTVIHIKHESLNPAAGFFLPNTAGAEIHPNVTPLPGEPVIVKHEVSSFDQTTLLNELKSKAIDHLVICGMQTNVCVRSATLDGLKRKFKVTLVDDAVAAKDKAVHQKALQEMIDCKAIILKTATLIPQLGQVERE